MAIVAPLISAAVAGGGAAAAGGSLLTALSVGSAALTGISAIQAGNYQAAVARNNALVAEQNAVEASRAAQEEQKRSDIEYGALLADQFAAQGASGLDIDSRSFRAGRRLTRRVGRQAAGDIRRRGNVAARNSLQDAANFRAEGKAAKRQGYITAAGAALGAAGDILKQGSLVRKSNGGRRPWESSAAPNWYGRG